MSDLITYEDKIRLKSQNVSDKYKVTAEDMNEIKEVVNNNGAMVDNKLDVSDVLNQASTDTDKPYSADYLNDKLVSVGVEAPENGERVWFSKSKNLLSIERAENNVSSPKVVSGLSYIFDIGSNVVRVEGTSTTGASGTNFLIKGRFPAGTYTVSGFPNKNVGINDRGTLYLWYDTTPNASLNNQDEIFTSVYGSKTFTASQEFSLGFRIISDNGTTAGGVYDETYELQLEKGSTATSYEPYIEPSINVDEEEIFNKNTFDQNTSLITEYGNRMTLWGCEELGEKRTDYDANNCLPGQSFFWSVGSAPTNVPSPVTGGRIYCFQGYGRAGRFQLCFDYPASVGRIYFRNYFAGTWGGWRYISLTAL